MKIYQIIDGSGEEVTYFKEKPVKMSKGNEYDGYDYTDGFLFPVPLKPLQIATITVNENGTWSWEIEREEGWYIARWSDKIDTPTGRKNVLVEYKNSQYSFSSGTKISDSDLAELTISTTRIPDECMI